MKLDLTLTRHVANLSSLAIPEADLPRVAEQLSAIVEAVELLGQADTAGVAPLSLAPATPPSRDDAAVAQVSADEALANAPKAVRGAFAIPKVIP